jgi:cytochrome P450
MVQFGAGKRVRFGKTLARNMLFLIFSTLMQEFIFKIPGGDPTPLTDTVSGSTTTPTPFRVEVLER